MALRRRRKPVAVDRTYTTVLHGQEVTVKVYPPQPSNEPRWALPTQHHYSVDVDAFGSPAGLHPSDEPVLPGSPRSRASLTGVEK